MALINYLFGKGCLKNDTKRDAGKPLPTDLKEWKDLSYDKRYGKWGLLDVYRKDVDGPLPTAAIYTGRRKSTPAMRKPWPMTAMSSFVSTILWPRDIASRPSFIAWMKFFPL